MTHAVCVGMTGSGKTGLCIGLLEEAAIDGIPAIVIDPKGDLTNLLLTFPDLSGEDFLPWINEEDARKKGLTPEEYAQQQAEMWAKGLGDWGQTGDRIRRLQGSGRFRHLHPGQQRRHPGLDPEVVRRAGGCHSRRQRGDAASASARPPPACSACSASTPTRCRAASTSCWRRSSTPPGSRGRTWTWPRSSSRCRRRR